PPVSEPGLEREPDPRGHRPDVLRVATVHDLARVGVRDRLSRERRPREHVPAGQIERDAGCEPPGEAQVDLRAEIPGITTAIGHATDPADAVRASDRRGATI